MVTAAQRLYRISDHCLRQRFSKRYPHYHKQTGYIISVAILPIDSFINNFSIIRLSKLFYAYKLPWG